MGCAPTSHCAPFGIGGDAARRPLLTFVIIFGGGYFTVCRRKKQQERQTTTTTERKKGGGGGWTRWCALLYLDLDAAVAAVALRAPSSLVHLLPLLASAPDQWAEPGTKDEGGNKAQNLLWSLRVYRVGMGDGGGS